MKKYLLIFLLIGVWSCEDEKESQNDSISNNNNDGDSVYGCTDIDATNYNSDATVDDGSCEYGSASVSGNETNISYTQGTEIASMSFTLTNTGSVIAYNVRYRLKISYKCLSNFASQGWTNEFLPNSSTLYTYGNIDPGGVIVLNDDVTLCSDLGIDQFTFEVYQVVWD